MNDKLLSAIEQRNASEVRKIVKGGMFSKPVDVNEYDRTGSTLLIYAVEKNCAEIVKVLISAGADVNAREKGAFRETPLLRACKYFEIGDETSLREKSLIVKLLIEAGADVNAYGSETALKRAVKGVYECYWKDQGLKYTGKKGVRAECLLEIVELLVVSGADTTNAMSFDVGNIPEFQRLDQLLSDSNRLVNAAREWRKLHATTLMGTYYKLHGQKYDKKEVFDAVLRGTSGEIMRKYGISEEEMRDIISKYFSQFTGN